MVIVIAGILSAVVANRISLTKFDTDGYADQVKAAVRYAQKVAVAQRRSVYLVVSATDVSLCYDAACTSAVTEPPKSSAFKPPAPGGVTPSTASDFFFDSLGRPRITSTTALATSTLTLTLTSSDRTRTLSIEPETGFVH